MTEKEIDLLRAVVLWCRDAAEKATRSHRTDEALGLLRAAARLEQELPVSAR